MRVCRTCSKELPDGEFSIRETGRPRTDCKSCVYARVKAWRAANRERYLANQNEARAKRRSDPSRRARELELDAARRRKKSRVGRMESFTCKRCGDKSEYEVKRSPRQLCDLCRRYNSDWRSFGLTGPEAARLRSRAACDICRKTENPGGRFNEWMIDHCHESGVVRGLLCAACNTSLGQMGNDPARLRAAADYLERGTR